MTTLFARMETAVSAAVDNVYGEPTRIVPRKMGEFVRGSSDPTRMERDVMGVIDFNPVTVRSKEMSEYDGYRPELDGEKVHVSYTASRLGSPVIPPAVGDYIVALDRPGTPRFQVVSVEADGIGRILCRCTPAEP